MRPKQIHIQSIRFSTGKSVKCKPIYGMSHFKTIVLIFIFLFAGNTQAINQCSKIFNTLFNEAEITTINPNANINMYKTNPFINKKMWDTTMMGIMGEMYNLTTGSQNDRNIPEINEALKIGIDIRTKKIIAEETTPVTSQHLQIINRTVKISSLTGDTKLVTVKNYSVGNNIPELERAIRIYFSSSYLKLVNWVYRLSNLEKDNPASSATMMDEVAVYALQKKGFEFNLIYDNRILDIHLQRIAYIINEYEATTDILKRANALKKLEVEIPLMPIAGVSVAFSIADTNTPVELKRYFKHEPEDPLNFADVKQKNEFKLRHLMLYRIIEELPAGKVIEIHAHTKAHIIAYAKLGFIDAGLITNLKYPDIKIHLLKATREQALLHIKSILDSLE